MRAPMIAPAMAVAVSDFSQDVFHVYLRHSQTKAQNLIPLTLFAWPMPHISASCRISEYIRPLGRPQVYDMNACPQSRFSVFRECPTVNGAFSIDGNDSLSLGGTRLFCQLYYC